MRKLLLCITLLIPFGACDTPCKDNCNGPVDLAQVFSVDMAEESIVDMAKSSGPSSPTCVPPGTLTCPSGTTFYSSTTSSGCFTTPTKPPNPNPDPGYDNPAGTCASVGDVVVQCNPGCSFCLKMGAALPPGCSIQ